MPCTSPIKAYRSRQRAANGGYGITFQATKALNPDLPIMMPCNQCISCKLDRAYQWAARCHHEAQMHEHNAFITLTYNDQSVPTDYSVKLRDWQKFMYRLRKAHGHRIRFLAVGEYGGLYHRPHYHALLFGHWFPDQVLVKHGKFGPVYTSSKLSDLWPFGSHQLEAVTPRSAGYCARYSMKKVNGDRADPHYTRISPIDGNTYRVATEFMVMSRRPGIGSTWFDKHKADAFPTATVTRDGKTFTRPMADFIVIDGQRRKVPTFYQRKLTDDEAEKVKRLHKRASLKHKSNNTPERLKTREALQQIRAKRLLRTMES